MIVDVKLVAIWHKCDFHSDSYYFKFNQHYIYSKENLLPLILVWKIWLPPWTLSKLGGWVIFLMSMDVTP